MKLLYLFLFILLVQCTNIVLGDTLTINDANDWKALVTQASGGSFPEEISLSGDLDLSGVELSPLGVNPEGVCIPFTGTLNGNNHKIQNAKINKTDDALFSDAGLFCGLGDGALIKNLIIDETCSFTGTMVGVLSFCLWIGNNETSHNKGFCEWY